MAGGVLFQIADLIIERGISMWVVTRLFLYRLPEVIALVIPMSSLLAALLTFGGLSGRSEIVAFRASGISFQRVLRPVVLLSLGVVFLSILWNETVVPLSNRAYHAVMQTEVLKERPSLVRERIFLREESQGHLKRVIYIDRLKPKAGKMEKILVQEFDKGRLSRILSAEKGTWEGGTWTLEEGKIYDVSPTGVVSLLMTFESQTVPLELSPLQMEQSNRDPDSMGIVELFHQISVVSAHGGRCASSLGLSAYASRLSLGYSGAGSGGSLSWGAPSPGGSGDWLGDEYSRGLRVLCGNVFLSGSGSGGKGAGFCGSMVPGLPLPGARRISRGAGE